jgi:hypothetical protein
MVFYNGRYDVSLYAKQHIRNENDSCFRYYWHFRFLSYRTDAQTIKKLKDGRWYAEFTVKEDRIPFVFEVEVQRLYRS